MQAIEMERTATGIDISAIGRNAHRDDVRAERAEEFGAEFVSGAVGTVKDDAKGGQAGSGKDAAAEKFEILGVERGVRDEERRIFRRSIAAMFENSGFELLFDGIGEFHAGVGEEFYAVVVIRIVRGGNNDARLKIILTNEAGDTGSGDYSCESDAAASLLKACGKQSGDVRAGFAGVHADENVGGRVFAEQIGGERKASGKKGGVVERRSAGNTTNAIGSEKFFGHERLTFNS